MMIAIAPIKTMAPKIIRPILHLNIRNLHHNKVAGSNHTNNHTHCYPATEWTPIKETSDVLWAHKPKSKAEKNRDHRQHDTGRSNTCSHDANLSLDTHTFTNSK